MQRGKMEGKGKNWGNYTATVTLQKYDANFKLLKQVELPNSAGKISSNYGEIHQLGSKYYFIYLQAQEGDELGDFKAIEVNPATMEFAGPKVIASSKGLGFRAPDFRYLMFLGVCHKASPSGKSSMLLLMYRDEFFVCCMDENLNLRWKKKESAKAIPAPDIRDAEVDDAGNIYIGYKDKLKARYRQYSISGESIDRPVVLPEGSANIILFKATPDTVFVAGTYRKGDNCNGVYKGVVDKKGDLGSLTSQEFPTTLIKLLDNDGWASTKSKKYGIEPEFSAELKLSGDGSLVMVSEFSSEAGTPGIEYMHVGGVIQVYFDKSEIRFARVPKYSVGAARLQYAEHSLRTAGHFYFAFTTSSETIIIYGDNPENLSRNIEASPKTLAPSRQILVAARIDKNGNVTREKVIPQPIAGNQTVDAESIVIPVSIDGVDQLVILKK